MKYAKNGLIRFVGHLDTVRSLLRAVRRAGIEGVYSQGFTPRLRLSFGPPLPLGCTSDCEYIDIKLARMCEPEVIKERLQSQLPQGLVVEKVEMLEGRPPPLQTAFWAAEYEVELPRDCPIGFENVQRLGFVNGSSRDHSAESSDSVKGKGEMRSSLAKAQRSQRRGGSDRILRASWRGKDGGRHLLSLVLRQDAPGGGRLKEIIGSFLGIEGGELEKLRIHKKRVYWRGERI